MINNASHKCLQDGDWHCTSMFGSDCSPIIIIYRKNAVTSLKYFIFHKSACKDSPLLFSSCISMKNEKNEIKLYRGQQQGSKSKNVKPAFLLPALYSGLESH